MRPCLTVVVHDVADATLGACERVLDAISDVADVPVTLLAVPRYHCAPASTTLCRFLDQRLACGDELVLHGYTHQDDGQPRGFIDRLMRTKYTRGEGEFVQLDAEESARRIAAGMRWFERNGWPLQGFVAPAWLLGAPAWQALQATTLRYTCTLGRIVLLPQREHVNSLSLVYSSYTPLRRACSIPYNATIALAQKHNPILRLELHPHDADHPRVRRSWQKLLATEIRRRRAMTLGQLAERLHERAAWERERIEARARGSEPPAPRDSSSLPAAREPLRGRGAVARAAPVSEPGEHGLRHQRTEERAHSHV